MAAMARSRAPMAGDGGVSRRGSEVMDGEVGGAASEAGVRLAGRSSSSKRRGGLRRLRPALRAAGRSGSSGGEEEGQRGPPVEALDGRPV